ncbi:MAG: putative baseplate assembly protein [Ilumatobacter fluminis]|uniref:putative baseplate assembly protein n=1 Tax=Ilumatobacter fluminis TaxID=467091 RepID=UPI0032EB7E51
MSLPVTNLDDRAFQDIVDEAKRLIPTFCPEWTNHNVSDPGVALIELFAWMTEMSLYRLNQVPDVFYTRMLNLLGFDRFPAKSARVPLTFWLTSTQAQRVSVPKGTEVQTSGTSDGSRVFTTLEDLTIEQPEIVAALTSTGESSYQTVWDDLRLGLSPVTCFTSQPLTPGDAFYVGFSDSLAGNVIRLDVTANVEGIGVVPDNPPLAWEVWQGEGWVPATIPTGLVGDVRADTTGGLNRNGSVMLLIPAKHEPMTLGGDRAYWLRARLIPSTADRPPYTASPQLIGIDAVSLGGTASGEHSTLVIRESLGTSDGKPGQELRLANRPVLARTPDERLEVTLDDGTVTDWEEVDNFMRSGPDDRHYVIDSTTGQVHFGPQIRYPDGSSRRHGAIPPERATIVMTQYRAGGGNAGNVGSNTLTTLRTTIPYVSGVTNLVPATGGVDAESVENAKLRGPMSIRTGSRAVTASDYERLAAEADPGVGRVRCLPPSEPGAPIRLMVVPKLEKPSATLNLDDFALSDSIISRVTNYLDERRILGSTVEIGTPFYQGITVAVLAYAKPGRPHTLVRERVQAMLYRYLDPLTGGPDGQGWPFDSALNAATIYQLAETVEGVDRVDEVLFFEYDLRNHERIGFGKEVVRLGDDSLFLSANHQVVVR